ncbi:MAG: DUF3108 domain-containing protein [Gammaproteobacteria bacterium]
MPKIITALIILLSSLAGQAEPQLSRLSPPVFEVQYNLYRSGAKIARIQRRISQLENSQFEYSSETKTIGVVSLFRKDHIIEKSIWDFHDNIPKPGFYSYQHTGGKKDRAVSIRFDWDEFRITNTINGDAWQMPTEPAAMDKLLYQVALMLDLEAGNSVFSYSIADGGKIKNYTFEKLGSETIKTSLGEFDTIKMIRYKDNGKRSVTFWCAKALRFLPVRVENIEKSGKKTVAKIRSLNGISSAAAEVP